MKTLDFNRELVKRCTRGDRAAQYEMYGKYSKAMYNTCVRMVGDKVLAEDLLQEAFVDVFRNIKSYKGQSTPGAWIKRIVVNNCISHLRKRKMYFSEIDDAVQMIEHTEEAVDTHHYEVQQIKDAMRKLPQGYKVIFSLYAVEGYDHEEIAQILDISTSTSKSQYHRAKKKIRELIK